MTHPKRSQVARSSLPLRYPARRWLIFWTLTLSLLSMTYWVGHTWRDGKAADWRGDALWSWANQLFGGIAGLITGSNGDAIIPASARFLALALLIGVLIIWHRAMLASIAYKPGPIDVQPIENATGKAQELPLGDLTAQFRHQLSETSLYPPPGIPTPPPGSFLDLVGDIETEPGRFGASLVRIMGRLHPQLAYRVKGELRIQPREPRYGMTVTVTSYALGGCRMTTQWARSWSEVVDRGACWVVASILPVTRAAKSPPWRDWVGRQLPHRLFGNYQKAQRLVSERRYDDALHRFYEALNYDPLNPYIRHELAGAQKNYGLYLDALDMIQGPLIFDGQDQDDYYERLWGEKQIRRQLRYLKHLRRHPESIDVRYAYVSILGSSLTPRQERPGDQLPEQWCHKGGHDARSNKRQQIRERLIPLLADRYWPIGLKPDEASGCELHDVSPQTVQEAKDRIRAILGSESEADPRAVRVFFMQAHLQEMYRLSRDRRLAYLVFVRPSRTWTTLRLYRDFLAPLRLARTMQDLPKEPPFDRWLIPDFGWKRKIHEGVLSRAEGKLPNCQGLKKGVQSLLRFSHWPLPIDSRQWQDHYNAACVYALGIRNHDIAHAGSPPEEEINPREEAIKELRRAFHSADSAYTTVTTEKRIWLVNNDQDLVDLRGHPEFNNLTSQVYPHERARGEFVGDIVRRLALYDERLISELAHAMEETWHLRKPSSPPAVHTVIQWLSIEKELWRCLRDVAKVRARDWPTRLELKQKITRAAAPEVISGHDFPPLPQPEEIDATAKESPEELGKLLGAYEAYLTSASDPSTAKTEEWLTLLRSADSSGVEELSLKETDRLCRGYAAAWQTIADLFSPDVWLAESPDRLIGTAMGRIPLAPDKRALVSG